MAQSCNLGTKEGKAGGSEGQGYLWIHNKSEESQDYMKKNVKMKQDRILPRVQIGSVKLREQLSPSERGLGGDRGDMTLSF